MHIDADHCFVEFELVSLPHAVCVYQQFESVLFWAITKPATILECCEGVGLGAWLRGVSGYAG